MPVEGLVIVKQVVKVNEHDSRQDHLTALRQEVIGTFQPTESKHIRLEKIENYSTMKHHHNAEYMTRGDMNSCGAFCAKSQCL